MQSRLTCALTVLLMVASTQALAQPRDARTPWHADVAPPRRGLPAVSVDVGYAGAYVPSFSSPVVMRATAQDAGFDGYIGFHFEVKTRRTIDLPVVARAALQPHQNWTFRTTAALHAWANTTKGPDAGERPAREVVVEWRDRAMKVIAEANAGTPPWIDRADRRLPLRIVSTIAPVATAFGGAAHAETPDSLADYGQWYAGFSSVVVPLALWLDLPQTVRDAIFGAVNEVVFIGFARADQKIDRATEALLPVAFRDGDAEYSVPWPYGSGRVRATRTWSAKKTAGYVGSSTNPYIVRTLASSWVADEGALARPLPSLVPMQSQARFIDIGPETTEYRELVWAAIAILIAAAVWALVRTSRTVAAVLLLIAFIATAAMSRDRIRKQWAADDYPLRASFAPGIGIEYHLRFDRGPSPLFGATADRRSTAGSVWSPGDVEVRTSDALPFMGIMKTADDWAFRIRWTMQRTLADATPERVVRFTGRDLSDLIIMEGFPAQNQREYMVEGGLESLDGNRMRTAFALPEGVRPNRTARLVLSNAIGRTPVALAWNGGSMSIPPRALDSGLSECAIPPDVLRAIENGGGIFEATVTSSGHVLHPIYYVRLHVQEKS